MWSSRPYCKAVAIGKWTRDVSEWAGASQEQLKPHKISVVVAAVRPNAATTWGMVGECKVELMLDSGSSISLTQESVAAAFSTEYNTVSFGSKLVSASGDNIPVLGCMTLSLCIGEVQASRPLVVVQSFIVPVILGLDFLQKHGMVLDFTSNPVKISSQPKERDYSDNVKTVLDIARKVTNKTCAVQGTDRNNTRFS